MFTDIASTILPIVIICSLVLRKDIKSWAFAIPLIIVFFVGGGLRILGLSDVSEKIEKIKKENNYGDKNMFYIAFANQAFLIVLFVFTCPLIGKKNNEKNSLN